MFNYGKQAFAAAAVALAFAAPTAQAATVDTALSLVIDVSGSIDSGEYNLQMLGYANAFRDTAIQDLILNTDGGNREGKLAVNVVQFGTNASEQLGFRVLDSVQAINDFADELYSGMTVATGSPLARSESGFTNIAAGVQLADQTITNWLTSNMAGRTVIDVSGDGEQNRTLGGSSGSSAQYAAALDGVMSSVCGNVDAVNTIGIDTPAIDTYYDMEVVCGTNSFGLFATSFDNFEDAIRDKLRFEITGTTPDVPLPAAGWMLIAGLGGLVAAKRRKG